MTSLDTKNMTNQQRKERCKSHPNCSHNTNGRDLSLPCSIEFKSHQEKATLNTFKEEAANKLGETFSILYTRQVTRAVLQEVEMKLTQLTSENYSAAHALGRKEVLIEKDQKLADICFYEGKQAGRKEMAEEILKESENHYGNFNPIASLQSFINELINKV